MTSAAPTSDAFFWDSLEILEGQHWISREFRGRGELEFSGSLRISGEWQGLVHARAKESQLHVMKSAVLTGTIRVERVSVEGHLKDIEVEADWIRVMPGARVSGRLRSKVIVIDEGALIEGRVFSSSKRG